MNSYWYFTRNGIFNKKLIKERQKSTTFAELKRHAGMKLFLKISFLLLITFNFFGSYAGKVVKTVNNIEVRQTSNIHQDINCPQVPESLSVFKRFRHGIDETFVSINKYSDRVYINIDLSLNDVYFYQSWIKYFFISCQAMPGYETHLSSLPLRSPPFSC